MVNVCSFTKTNLAQTVASDGMSLIAESIGLIAKKASSSFACVVELLGRGSTPLSTGGSPVSLFMGISAPFRVKASPL